MVEAPNRTPALAEKSLPEEQCHHETAMQERALADEANEQCRAAARDKALVDEANERRQVAAQEKALVDEANEQRRAAARDKALVEEANKQRRAATQEKALADEANEQCQAAAQDKALADKANEQRCQELAERTTTLATKALAKDEHNKDDDDVAQQLEAYTAPLFARVDAIMAKIQAMDDGFGNWAAFGDELEDDKASTPARPPLAPLTAVSSPPHHPKSYVDTVLSNMGGSSQAKSLPLAQVALPLLAVDSQLRMACQRNRPCCCVGCRHGPRAPNPQEHLLCGRQHRPHAPNQSTVNGWA
jgi:hypothetical protein